MIGHESHAVRVSRARTALLLDHPWFGSLAMRLRLEAIQDAQSCPTFQTDGTVLQYNPEFLGTLTDAHLVGILAHEVMHCAMLHPFRRGHRDHEQWNIACDYAINGELQAAGLQLPTDALLDAQYRGLSAEVVYAKRAQEKPDPNGAPSPQPGNDTAGNPLSTGSVSDAPQPGSQSADSSQPGNGNGTPSHQPGKGTPDQSRTMTESDWQIAAEQATRVSRAAGKMPGDLERAVKKTRESQEDWRAILREFIDRTQPADYSWTTPNRRHVANGLYLPGIVRENLGRIAVAVDTSGSISPEVLSAFAAELTAITLEAQPESVTVLYCDTSINRTQEFTPDDGAITLTPCGGGGTLFQPVFDWLNDPANGEQPACLLYMTDLECYDSPVEPEYPVLWVTGLEVTGGGPFGRTVRVSTN